MWTCPNCQRENEAENQNCWYCRNERLTPEHYKANPELHPEYHEIRYPALRTLSYITRAVAYLIMAVSLAVSIALHNQFGAKMWYLSVSAFFVGLMMFVIILAHSEMLRVYVDIEHNTRRISLK